MDYQLHELGDGRVEVVYLEPVVIGVLADRRIAEKFAEFLTDLDRENQRDMAQFIRSDAGATADVGTTLEGKNDERSPAFDIDNGIVTFTANRMVVEVDSGDTVASTVSAETETPIKEAFRRIRDGEALGVVADDIGIPMPRLHALWAQASKVSAKADQIPAPADAPSAPSEASPTPITLVEADCTGCGRPFKLAPDSDGLCARCHRQVTR